MIYIKEPFLSQTKCWVKEVTHKRGHATWFRLYDSEDERKQIYGDRGQQVLPLGGIDWEGAVKESLGYIDLGGGVHICDTTELYILDNLTWLLVNYAIDE